MEHKQGVLKRGIAYEIVVFIYAMLLTWMIMGNPFKSFLLTLGITITKFPLYYIFHCKWRTK